MLLRAVKGLKSTGKSLSSNRFLSVAKATEANEEVKTYALEYTYVNGMAEKRTPHRPAHLEFTESFVDDNILIAGGAFVPGLEGGLLIFKCKKSIVEDYAKRDPYVLNGLVPEYKIREWLVVVGKI